MSVRPKARLETVLERGLFASRWLVAPFYVGLALALFLLMIVFVRDVFVEFTGVLRMTPDEAIMAVLTLIDLSLAANLLLIVIFSGYETFVSKIEPAHGEDRPDWMGHVDFSGLKLKLIASIVAISGVSLLKAFMKITDANAVVNETELRWMAGVHGLFVLSGLFMAITDWFVSRTKVGKT